MMITMENKRRVTVAEANGNVPPGAPRGDGDGGDEFVTVCFRTCADIALMEATDYDALGRWVAVIAADVRTNGT